MALIANNRSLQGELMTMLEESTGLRKNGMGAEEAIAKLRSQDFTVRRLTHGQNLDTALSGQTAIGALLL